MANTTEAIDAYLRRLQAGITRDERSGQAVMPGAVASVVNGLTFGFGDEAVALGRSTFGSTSYDDALGQERASRERYSAEHPYLAAGAELVGAAPTMLIPMSWWGRAAQGANRAQQFGRAALTGATSGGISGAVQGFGEGEGGIENRAAGALVGGGVGAALGGAGGALIEGAAPAARALVTAGENIVAPGRAAARVAANEVSRDLPVQGGVRAAVDDAANAATAREAAGLPATGQTFAEVVGPNSRGALEALANQPGQAMTRVTNQMEQRAAGRMDRIDQGLAATFGDAADAWTQQQAMFARRSADAQPLYQQAFDAARPLDAIDHQLLRQVPQSAVQEAVTRAGMRGEHLSFVPQFDDRGFMIVRAGITPTARDMHVIKSGLDRLIENNTDALSGRMNGVANDARALRDNVRNRLDQLTTDPQGRSLYQQARQTWAGESANIDAQRLGLRVFDGGMGPAQLRHEIGQMGEAERAAFLEGAMNAMRQRLGSVRTTGSANPVNAIAGTPNQRALMDTVGDAMGLPPGQIQQRMTLLQQFLATENVGHQAEGAIMRNSATARRQAFQANLASPLAGAAAGGASSYGTGADPLTSAIAGASLMAGGRAVQANALGRRNDAVAQMLGTTGSGAMTALARRLELIRAAQATQARGVAPGAAQAGGMLLGSGPLGGDQTRRGLLD